MNAFRAVKQTATINLRLPAQSIKRNLREMGLIKTFERSDDAEEPARVGTRKIGATRLICGIPSPAIKISGKAFRSNHHMQTKQSHAAQLSSRIESASEQLRENGAAALEWVAGYLERVESLPVLAQVKPGEILASLPQHPPPKAEPFEIFLPVRVRKSLPAINNG